MRSCSSLAGQRVLVTGAAGFVGSHLVNTLTKAGVDVTALSRRNCDLTDRDAIHTVVAAARPDVVFHLAAARESANQQQRSTTTTVNVTSGEWLIEALPQACRAVIRLGSSTEYGASPTPMNESSPLRPRGFFGATKAAGSLLFTATAAERGIRSCVLRAFQIYGPADKATRFVPSVLSAARTGRELSLTRAGLRRDWVWVSDVVQACLLAAEDDDLTPGAVYNIGTGTQTTNEELVALAEHVTGRPIRTLPGAHPGRDWDTADWVCDASAAAAELGWKPKVDLADGLARCWAAL